MLHAIYTADQANRAAWPYTRTYKQTQPGNHNQIVGTVLASHLQQLSYVVVRRRTRAPYTTVQLQHANYGSQGVAKPRVLFKVKSVCWVVAKLDWDTGEVEEISAWPTQKQAQNEARRLHHIAQ